MTYKKTKISIPTWNELYPFKDSYDFKTKKNQLSMTGGMSRNGRRRSHNIRLSQYNNNNNNNNHDDIYSAVIYCASHMRESI